MAKPMPKFKNENQEREFWAKNDSADYVNWNKAKINPAFPGLKPSLRSVSIRLPENMIFRLKEMANKRDIPYQSLVKMILDEKIQKEAVTLKY